MLLKIYFTKKKKMFLLYFFTVIGVVVKYVVLELIMTKMNNFAVKGFEYNLGCSESMFVNKKK